MTTLIEIGRAVADKVQLDRPLALAGSTDPGGQLLLQLAQEAGEAVARAHPWAALRREHVFAALAQEEQAGALPADFDRLLPETLWDRSGRVRLTGPVPPATWAALKAESHAGRRRFALRAGTLLVLPAPAGGESYAFEYVSRHWCASAGGAGQAAWAADSDTALVDAILVQLHMTAAFLDGEGQPAGLAMARYRERLSELIAGDQAELAVLSAGDVFERGY